MPSEFVVTIQGDAGTRATDHARVALTATGVRVTICGPVADAIHTRIAELEAALAWYADPDVHLSRGFRGELRSMAAADGGALARRTLGERWEDIVSAHVNLDL